MINKRQTLCPSHRQRRRTIERAQLVLAQAENLLVVAIFFIVFLYPLLLDPTLLFNLPAWLWWVKGYAWIGLLAWVALHLFVGLPIAPSQLLGASVDAMAQSAPEKELVSFTVVPIEIECTQLPCQQMPDFIEQDTCIQLQSVWRQLRQRPYRGLRLNSPFQRFIPPPSRLLKPSA